MNLWTRLKTLLTGRSKFMRQYQGKVTLAFTHAGTEYYQFTDHFSLPTSRGLAALDVYDELEMRCSKDFLKAHVAAVLDILNPAPGARLDLTRLGRLVKNLEERLTMLPVPDHIYKLASVVYFTSDEDPYSYDRIAAGKKIERWKKDPDILAFFLQGPLRELVPLSGTDARNFPIFGQLVDKVNELHRSAVSSKSSGKPMKIVM